MPAGFRVLKRQRMVDPAWVERFRRIPVANVSDSMFRMSAGGARLRPYHKGGAMAGPAVTVRTAPGDNLMVHMALNLAENGDVIVVDAGGELTNAIIGERMLAYCQAKGFDGIVINGAVRDVGYIRVHDFPVYAAGVTHRGPYKNGPAEINVTVRAVRLPTGVYPLRRADHALAVIRRAYPAVHGCGDALSGALMNAGPVIHHLDQFFSGLFDRDRDRARPGIEGIFQQFRDDRSRSFDHLTRRDLRGNFRRKQATRHGEIITRRAL